jgi:hypothetical protein
VTNIGVGFRLTLRLNIRREKEAERDKRGLMSTRKRAPAVKSIKIVLDHTFHDLAKIFKADPSTAQSIAKSIRRFKRYLQRPPS